MKNRLFKFELDFKPQQSIMMPAGATIHSAQPQRDLLCIWATVDTDAPPELRHFVLFVTGDTLPDDASGLRFITTIQGVGLMGEVLVFHLFETAQPLA